MGGVAKLFRDVDSRDLAKELFARIDLLLSPFTRIEKKKHNGSVAI